MAALIATILYLKIKGFKSFLNEIKNLKNDETSSTFTQKTLTGNILPITTTTTKEKEQATPEYKTPPKKQASTTDAKTITEKTDDATQKNVKQPSIETRFEKANESLKMLVDNSKKIQDDAKSKKSDTHLLPEDHEKIVEMLKKPAKIHKNSESQRTPRFYFKEESKTVSK
uniref:Uncharacterized protein n=1 Tax=Panagrolaimus sp. JU765 TaxID=591449 RepID=A0AC34RQS7_9BILA